MSHPRKVVIQPFTTCKLVALILIFLLFSILIICNIWNSKGGFRIPCNPPLGTSLSSNSCFSRSLVFQLPAYAAQQFLWERTWSETVKTSNSEISHFEARLLTATDQCLTSGLKVRAITAITHFIKDWKFESTRTWRYFPRICRS